MVPLLHRHRLLFQNGSRQPRPAHALPRNGKGDEPPLVDPWVIPPPARGSQYASSSGGGNSGGGRAWGGGGGGDGAWGNGGGGGGNRGGAYNMFNGGFFGPGGRLNLLGRLRLLVMFWAWCTFLAIAVNSVFKLALQATSNITLPSWQDGEEAAAAPESQAQKLSGRSTMDATSVTATQGAEAILPAASVANAGAAAVAGEASLEAAATPGVEAEAVEVQGVDQEERAYISMLRAKHAARALQSQDTAVKDGQIQPGLSAWSLGLYLMLMGAVSFFSWAK